MLRVLIIFVILFLMDLYLFQGLKQIWSSKWVFGLIYGTLSLLFYLWIFLAIYDVTDTWEQRYPWYIYLRAFFFILVFAKILALVPILIDDLRRGVGYLIQLFATEENEKYLAARNQFLSRLSLVMAGIPLFLLTYGMIRNPFRFKRQLQRIPIKGLPKELEGLKIVQISDLHSGTFKDGRLFQRAVDMINQEEPDLVFFTGDLVNNTAHEADPFIDVFKDIRAQCGVYSILGNHDYGDYVRWPSEREKQANFEALCLQHRKMGWKLLRNEHISLEINGKRLNILGVENYSALPQFPKYGDLFKARQGAPQADMNILLSHDPTHWDSSIVHKEKDVQLTFSGHTHGFQFGIEIPGFIRWSPSQWVYKHWAGLYQENNQYLYVNRGLGCLAYPGRVGILPEISVIKLESDVS